MTPEEEIKWKEERENYDQDKEKLYTFHRTFTLDSECIHCGKKELLCIDENEVYPLTYCCPDCTICYCSFFPGSFIERLKKYREEN